MTKQREKCAKQPILVNFRNNQYRILKPRPSVAYCWTHGNMRHTRAYYTNKREGHLYEAI